MISFIQTLKSLGMPRLIAMAGVLIFLMGFLVYVASHVGMPEMSILFNDLSATDSKKVIEKLEEQNIPYQLHANGTEIHVPTNMALKLRVQLSDTATTGGVVGYELFDKAQSPGVGHDVINLQILRALEGELSRTIQAIDSVKVARVHLVLPKREMFSREERPATASVIIRMDDGVSLRTPQVESIQRLVAAAVPKMKAQDVSITDSRGYLLTKNFDDDEQMQISTNEELRRDQEARLRNSVQELIEQSVGQEKVRVKVSLEMDFDQIVINKEVYNPDDQVLRSSTTIEESSKTDEKEPIVSVEENLPDADSDRANQVSQQANRTEETVNYEISKEVTSQVRKNGVIKRISVAVVVDGNYTLNQDGTRQYVPRDEKELELLATLVRSAVGYDAARGDTVEVVNLPFFNPDDILRLEDPIVFMGFTKNEVVKMVEGLSIAVVAVLVILLVIRPLIVRAFDTTDDDEYNNEEENLIMGPDGLARLAGPNAGGSLTEQEQLDDLIDIAKVEGRVTASSIKKIAEIIDENPKEAIAVIRAWLYSND